MDFAKTAFDLKTSATLWGKGSLGTTAAAADFVVATKVPTPSSRGAFAWAVMDEGVKVRINTPHVDGVTTNGLKTAQLGSGQRPNTTSIAGLDKLDRKFFQQGSAEFSTIEKGISRLNLGYAVDGLAAGSGSSLQSLTHEVSSASVGLFTDTASGGLKEDFSLLTNPATLPAPYLGKGVYNSRLGMSGVSDPRWESLQQFARLYRDTTRLTSSGGVPVLKAQVPSSWRAATGSDPATGRPGTIQRTPPPGVILMPTIAKVQVVFSLLTRDIYTYPKVSDTTPKVLGTADQERSQQLHNPWGNNFAGSSYDYLLHLLYTPVVTLHNPYNVAIEFNELKVLFGNVPFALQVFRNNIAQTTAPAPLDQMYYQDAERGLLNKRFGMTLKNKFTVEMFARSPSNIQVSSGVLEFDYETPKGLQDTLPGKDGTIRFPKTGTINAMAMHSHSTTPIKDIATAKPFAMISAQAKTTMGGLNPDGEDGKLV